jgi:hypothetical protein
MKKFAVLLVVGAVALSVGVVYADSSACDVGTDVGGGISVLQTGDPTTGAGSLTVCNDGSTIPVAGSATLAGDANTQQGYVDVDGDASNESLSSCADGFVRTDGSSFWHSPDGSFDDPDGDGEPGPAPSADDLATFLQSLAADCGA